MRRWAIALIFWGSLARGAEGFEVQSVALEYRLFHPTNKIPELFGRKAKEGMALTMDSRLFEVAGITGIWENRVHALTDSGQYRLVGWQFLLGLRWKALTIAYQHHSRHLLDASPSPNHFPVEDAVPLIRLQLFSR